MVERPHFEKTGHYLKFPSLTVIRSCKFISRFEILYQDFQKNIFFGILVLECSGVSAPKTKVSVVQSGKKMLHSKSFLWKFDSPSLLTHERTVKILQY
jgi:hypothetical protein